MSTLDLAVIGNCGFGALLDRRARLVWCCLPRFDGDPVFSSLLGGKKPDKGFYDVELENFARAEQSYRRNSAILDTRLIDRHGGAVEITDFAPRFKQYNRVFRPNMLIRHVRPVAGTPRVTIRLRPTYAYGAHVPQMTRGSNHIRYVAEDMVLRLTTDAPISYIQEERPFLLEAPLTLVLGPDESLTQSAEAIYRDFVEMTGDYWQEWVRNLSLPFEWQEAVIRAAITLKLSSFEESGAVIAAMTTSIPESANSERNWDYRFCWLRDAYFVVHTLNRLGVTRTMESYLNYILNIVASVEDGYLQPVFGITLEQRLEESIVESLEGYGGMGPVRLGNKAYEQVQNDGYGSVILACTQAFFDQRLTRPGDVSVFERLESLGHQALRRWDQDDAGLWELRNSRHVHTFSSVMCWAACDRLSRIASQLRLKGRAGYWRRQAEKIRAGIMERAWNRRLGAFTHTFDGKDVDASLLLLAELGFVEPDDKRFLGTLALVEKRLRRGDYMLRYATADDFGMPENAFNICTFWYLGALASVGRRDEARALFENMLAKRNMAGLLSEDLDPETGQLWGNFPQTYSLVGLIQTAMRLSKSWEDAF